MPAPVSAEQLVSERISSAAAGTATSRRTTRGRLRGDVGRHRVRVEDFDIRPKCRFSLKRAVVCRRKLLVVRPFALLGAGQELSCDYRIVAAMSERVASQKARSCLQPSAEYSEALNGFHCVFRARGCVTARRGKHGRNSPLVGLQHLDRSALWDATHERRPAFPFSCVTESARSPVLPPSFFSITTKAWRTSFSNASNSTVKTAFFGLITTSAFGPGRGRLRRTASRRRRFMRFRCTAPPKARPTVNPTRSPETCCPPAEPVAWRSR